MPRRIAPVALGLVGLIVLPSASSQGQDSPQLREARRFVKGLRDRGFHELVPTYTERLRHDLALPPDARAVLEYEEALSLLDQASIQNDLNRRAAMLETARGRFESFARENDQHPLASQALLQAARVLLERGHLAALQALESSEPAVHRTRQTEARTAYDHARAAYGKVIDRLKSTLDTYPKFLGDRDPRRDEREQVQRALMEADLQRALVDYHDAQTYALEADDKAERDSNLKERTKRLDLAATQFEEIFKNYRQNIAGLNARKMQAKCLEERAELGKAMGIYKELMEHDDPKLKVLQQEVGYYRLIVSNKRKEYTVAASDAIAWLRANPGTKGSPERLGVMLEKARALLASKPNLSRDQERDALDTLNEVVKYATPIRGEALRLLTQNRPKADKPTPIAANISYENALDQANKAINIQDWDRAIALLRAAIRAVDPAKDPDKANEARYNLAYCYFQADRYYEAGILAEHLVRRYPQFAKASQAAEIGLAAWTYAYNNYTQGDRRGDLDRLLDLARVILDKFPDSEQAQASRMTLGDAALQQGRYAEAAEAFEGVPSGTPRWLDSRMRSANARWRLSQRLRDDDKKAEADEQSRKSEALFQAALQARKDAGAEVTDPGYLNNVCDLAEVKLATDHATDALALLDPVVKAAVAAPRSDDSAAAFTRLISVQLRAHIAAGQTEAAIEDMRTLEKAGSQAAPLTQLYFGLGRLLQKELDSLKAKGDQERYKQTQLAYVRFLEALSESKSGQSYDSLQWSGEAMLGIGMIEPATRIFERVLQTYDKDDTFRATPGSDGKLLRTRLKLVTARRTKGDATTFQKALDEVESMVKEHPRALEPLLERCRVLEDWAEFDKSPKRWDTSISYWKQLATVLNKSKSPEQFEAWYHVAYGQMRKGSKPEALRTLKGILALSPKLNGPEMQKKYDELLKQLGP